MTHSSGTPEKRHFHRVAHDAPVLLKTSEREFPAKVVDLSLKGCLLAIPDDHPTANREEYTVEISLSEEVRIVMEVFQVRREGHHAGFACRHIDLDSISTLRRLVELNLGDASLLDRDLEALAKPPERPS